MFFCLPPLAARLISMFRRREIVPQPRRAANEPGIVTREWFIWTFYNNCIMVYNKTIR